MPKVRVLPADEQFVAAIDHTTYGLLIVSNKNIYKYEREVYGEDSQLIRIELDIRG